jgi:dTDP-4-amino-4,6-dideoxygalactose transaminase
MGEGVVTALAQPLTPNSKQTVPLTDLGAMTADVGEALDVAWKEITATSSFVGGQRVESFEKQWAQYCGTTHAVGVANGTDAIELTLRALGIGPGDEVIVPCNTFIATAEAVVLAGATPRFVDVDPETLLVTPEIIEAAIGPRTAAMVVVGLYGSMPAMDDIARLADATRLALIEDAAQAHGSTWQGKKAGSFGVAGCFSFYPGKNLGAFGDAGAVVTDDAALAERIRSLGNHGRRAAAGHIHELAGRNGRLDALQAAVLSAKLPRLDGWNRARRTVVATYRRLLSPDVRVVRVHQEAESNFHQHVIRVPDRDRIRATLGRAGIETGVHYPIPCHQQEPYRSFVTGPLAVAERAALEILSLPAFPHMTQWQVEYVATHLNHTVTRARRHVG